MQNISHKCLFQYKDGNLLGVVGTDVPMKEIINLAPAYQVYFFAIIFQNYISVVVYWSKVLTDQQGLCRYFWKHKIVKNLKTATTKQVIIHLSNLLKCFFRKSHYVIFLVKNGKYPTQIRTFNFTTVDYPVYWTFKITLSSIGFEWKKSVD